MICVVSPAFVLSASATSAANRAALQAASAPAAATTRIVHVYKRSPTGICPGEPFKITVPIKATVAQALAELNKVYPTAEPKYLLGADGCTLGDLDACPMETAYITVKVYGIPPTGR